MKKRSLFVLILFLIFGSIGYSLRKIINKYFLVGFSVEELNDNYVGISRDKIINKFGEPDGMCFGMYCDFYDLNDKKTAVSFYYDENDEVYEVMKIENSNE